MIYLLLSIIASSLIFIVFKLFDRFKINTLQAIIYNYFFACFTGLLAYNTRFSLSEILHKKWLLGAVLLGVLFIVIFYLMAITTQRSGLSVVSVATKMSLAIPILFGFIYYRESISFVKITGILLALTAVYFTSVKNEDALKVKPKNLIFPILVFLGSGVIDTSIKFLENSFVAKDEVPLFSATIFASAFVIGIMVLVFQKLKGNFNFESKNLLGGVALGIPNYFSIYFLVQALRANGLESSTIFTLNNVAIVMLSTLLGIILFKEKLLPKNWLGIGLAVLSLILVTLAA
ncbi:EamA family transporter [Leeuwenhoekiella sp. A16]|uniref:EamA family transporter n=1 Tax=unclassified Leeuwenhoekiella TaxID=2615029 RepID=UPI003A7F774D